MKKMLALCAFTLILGLCGCSSKTPATLEDFKTTMENAGYTIQDATDQLDSDAVKSVTLALKGNLKIEFFILTSEENAAYSFGINKEKLEALSGGNIKTSVTAANYNSYTLTTKEQFYMVSRIADTMIYLRVPLENKKEIVDLVESLGY